MVERLAPAAGPRFRDLGLELFDRRGEGGVEGRDSQSFFRLEVVVEAAMGEAGLPHELRDGDAVDALLAEEARRRLEHARPVRLGLGLADAHGCPAVQAASFQW